MTMGSGCSDSIIAELHALRERLAERFQGDLQAYSDTAEAHCRALGFHMAPSGTDNEFDTHHSDPGPTVAFLSPGDTDLAAQ